MTRRVAFTLVELLTVIAIITVLAGLSMVALNGSVQTAKEMKTLGTIQKLDAAVLQIFEGYQDRFENILDNAGYWDTAPEPDEWVPYTAGTLADQDVVVLKLHLIHDLMRMEMPAYWNEVIDGIPDSGLPDFDDDTNSKARGPIESEEYSGHKYALKSASPVIRYYYQSAARARQRNSSCSLDNGPAELLFLMIANLNPEALEGFGGNEIGDVDGNGLLEFLDAWGNSIYFLRAAPGFTDTDRQPDIVRMAKLGLSTAHSNVNNNLWSTEDSAIQARRDEAFKKAADHWSDPFDPGGDYGKTWFLYPVVMSAGPDGIFDISYGRTKPDLDSSDPRYSNADTDKHELVSPSASDAAESNPFNFPTGIPRNKMDDGVLNHYDNIHNHRISGGF